MNPTNQPNPNFYSDDPKISAVRIYCNLVGQNFQKTSVNIDIYLLFRPSYYLNVFYKTLAFNSSTQSMKNGSTVYHSLHQPRADPVEQEAQRDHGGGDRGTSDGGGGLYRVQGSNGCTMARITEFCPKLCCLFST